MEFLVLLLCYLIGLVVVLLITVPIHQKHIEVTHNIVNYDTFMRHFVFKIPLTAEQILDRLKIPNVFDELEYKLDLENSMITFLKDHEELSFWLEFQQSDGFCILLLHQLELSTRGNIFYLINPFWVKKCDAEIVPYSIYGPK